MTNEHKGRSYLPFDEHASSGYPAGGEFLYECTECGEVLPSKPLDSVMCSCGNLHIDADYGRVAIRSHEQFRIFRETTA